MNVSPNDDSSTPRRRTVRNTRHKDSLQDFYVEAVLLGGGSEAIVRQEAQGQREVVQSDTLPSDCDIEDRKALEAAGVIFGEPVPGDPLFRFVTLPDGWTKARTDHSMWSDLRDEQGRKRASIGYKAAFYDRWARLSATRRFSAGLDYSDTACKRQDTHNEYAGVVHDGDRVIWRQVFTDPKGADKYADDGAYHQAQIAARAWLDEHYPDHANPAAYWDLTTEQIDALAAARPATAAEGGEGGQHGS
jgi:hypothetical protein